MSEAAISSSDKFIFCISSKVLIAQNKTAAISEEEQ
jgi:hypothetical protein